MNLALLVALAFLAVAQAIPQTAPQKDCITTLRDSTCRDDACLRSRCAKESECQRTHTNCASLPSFQTLAKEKAKSCLRAIGDQTCGPDMGACLKQYCSENAECRRIAVNCDTIVQDAFWMPNMSHPVMPLPMSASSGVYKRGIGDDGASYSSTAMASGTPSASAETSKFPMSSPESSVEIPPPSAASASTPCESSTPAESPSGAALSTSQIESAPAPSDTPYSPTYSPASASESAGSPTDMPQSTSAGAASYTKAPAAPSQVPESGTPTSAMPSEAPSSPAGVPGPENSKMAMCLDAIREMSSSQHNKKEVCHEDECHANAVCQRLGVDCSKFEEAAGEKDHKKHHHHHHKGHEDHKDHKKHGNHGGDKEGKGQEGQHSAHGESKGMSNGDFDARYWRSNDYFVKRQTAQKLAARNHSRQQRQSFA